MAFLNSQSVQLANIDCRDEVVTAASLTYQLWNIDVIVVLI